MDEGAEKAVPFGSRLIHFGSLEGFAVAAGGSILRTHGEIDPPGAVVVPEMVVFIGAGDSNGDAESVFVVVCHDGVDWLDIPEAPCETGTRVRMDETRNGEVLGTDDLRSRIGPGRSRRLSCPAI